jgi:hypothetical protein
VSCGWQFERISESDEQPLRNVVFRLLCAEQNIKSALCEMKSFTAMSVVSFFSNLRSKQAWSRLECKTYSDTEKNQILMFGMLCRGDAISIPVKIE